MTTAEERAGTRVALVSGASRGIGAEIAVGLAAAHHAVAVGYRSNQDQAQAVCERILATGADAVAVPLDVTSPQSVDDAVATIEAELGTISVLVNNAGVTADGLFLRMDHAQWRAPLDTNLDGTYRLTHRVIRSMVRNRWGRIVNLSSVVALSGSAGQANYAAAKAALVGFSRSLARELGERQITVNVVAPGPISTEMLDALGSERTTELARTVPVGRLGQPQEVAAAVTFLASDDAAYITGAVIPVDGGLGLGH